ncbi:MAG: group II intron maturase-specific domain-containing protein [Pseudomonadota bacterium]
MKWHADAELKFKYRVKTLTGRSRGISMEKRINELTIYLRGWINYFGIGQGIQKCIDLDQWICRRLRMCYWKEWRNTRTKIRNLLKSGVPHDLAVSCGASGKSYWRSAKTEGINRALTNEFFAEKGLISLRDRWVEINYG